jgi:acetyl-CoA carboxylase biotin carboxyl carrier protein
MTREQIEQIAALLSGTDIGRLELTGPQGQWRINHDAGEIRIDFIPAKDRMTVTAPHAGVFLVSHPLRNAPLVTQSERVNQGQVIGLLQAGPLLKPVLSPCTGSVISIAVADGALVGFGTVLVELHAEPSGR